MRGLENKGSPGTYVTFIDGHAYSVGGIVGTLFTDAAIGIFAFTVAVILLAKFDSKTALAKESGALSEKAI